MSILNVLLKSIVNPPALIQREGKPPYASFNRYQFWLYPELCKQQASEALSYCPPAQQVRQRALLEAYFGAVIR